MYIKIYINCRLYYTEDYNIISIKCLRNYRDNLTRNLIFYVVKCRYFIKKKIRTRQKNEVLEITFRLTLIKTEDL